jgi:predicted secreted protein
MSVGTGDRWTQEKALETRLGSTFSIRLWEDRTRGEMYVPAFDPAAFSLVNDDYQRTIGDSAAAVDSGRRAFEFRALKPGVHRIVFEKRMGWKFTAEDRRVYVVTVTAEEGPAR